MTELQGTHPRKSDWIRYLCNGCDATFWAPWMPDNEERSLAWHDKLHYEKLHYCADCTTDHAGQSIHFTGGRGSPQEAHDRIYHGGLFTQGEW